MPTDIRETKSEKSVEQHQARRDKFYNQTPAENRARIAGIDNLADLKKEIAFIQSVLLLSGPP